MAYAKGMCQRCYYATRRGHPLEIERLKERNFLSGSVGVLTGPRGERWLVDAADFEQVRRWFWHDNGSGYARASTPDGEVYLHRLLMPGVNTVDHIDRDPHNCLRHNLRDGGHGINPLNSPKRQATRSRFRGVAAMRDKWQARINVRGTRYYLGTFITEEEAATAVAEFAKGQGRAAFY